MEPRTQQLIDTLQERTHEGRIEWTATEFVDSDRERTGYEVSIAGSEIAIVRVLRGGGDPFYYFRVVNADGTVVDSVSGLSGVNYAILNQLWSTVDRKVRKVDETIDGILVELEKLDRP